MDKHQFGAAANQWASAAPPALAWHQERPYEAAPRYAGFWRRFLANCIDGILLGISGSILDNILNGILDPVLNANASDPPLWLVIAVWLAAYFGLFTVVEWLYYAGMESSSRQATLGKRALGIVVTDLAGGRISFGRATGRFFAHFITFITFMIGYLIQPFTKKRQALHDLIAGTLVVRV